MKAIAKLGALGLIIAGIAVAYLGITMHVSGVVGLLMHGGGFAMAAYGGVLLMEA